LEQFNGHVRSAKPQILTFTLELRSNDNVLEVNDDESLHKALKIVKATKRPSAKNL
jgi:hypothetical protein